MCFIDVNTSYWRKSLTVSDVKYKPKANEINVITTQVIFIKVVSALTILANPMTVDAEANFLQDSVSCIVLLMLFSYTICEIHFLKLI